MKTLRSISELNWALKAYSEFVRFGIKESNSECFKDCLAILEEFEEYEKCSDLSKLQIQSDDHPLKI
jgi:hypothetical protein